MITINNLSKVYETKKVLSIENLDFQKGQTIVLVGNNGAGKTTLFSLILDLIEPSSGFVSIDGEKVNEWMNELAGKGSYTVDANTLRAMQSVFVGGFADETGILKTIREIYDRCDHIVDTHTAVGFNVYGRYYHRSADETKTIFVSTASPAIGFGNSSGTRWM